MSHIVILGYTVILLVGTWAAVYSHQMRRRFDRPFLRSFLYYIIVFNFSAFLYLFSRYVSVNLVRHDPASADPAAEGILLLVMLIVEIGLAYTVVRVVLELQRREPLRVFNLLFGLVMVLFVASYPIAWRLGFAGWSVWIVVRASMTIIVCAWIVLAFRKPAELDPNRRKADRWLAYFMLSGWVPLAASNLLPGSYRASVSVIAQLWLNLVPILWFHYFFLRYNVRLSPVGEGAHLEDLVRRHRISKREREIMELILEGKTNKEIEGQLFISFNTVKNHIYNLYQKLGVNSRSQLMHLVLKSREYRIEE